MQLHAAAGAPNHGGGVSDPERAGGLDSTGFDPLLLESWLEHLEAHPLVASPDPQALIEDVEGQIDAAEANAGGLEAGAVALGTNLGTATTAVQTVEDTTAVAQGKINDATTDTAAAQATIAAALSEVAATTSAAAEAETTANSARTHAQAETSKAASGRLTAKNSATRAANANSTAASAKSTAQQVPLSLVIGHQHNTNTIGTGAREYNATTVSNSELALPKASVALSKAGVALTKAATGQASAESGYTRSEQTIVSAVRGSDGRKLDAGNVVEVMEAEEMQMVNYGLNNFDWDGTPKENIVKLFSHTTSNNGQLKAISSAYDGTYDLELKVLEEFDGESRIQLWIDNVHIDSKVIPLCDKRLDGTYPTEDDARKQVEIDAAAGINTVENMDILTFPNVKIGYGSTVVLKVSTDAHKTFGRIDRIRFIKRN